MENCECSTSRSSFMAIKKMRNRDRLSALPDAILHQILSFLDMQQVVEKSLLSKRWRYLWISVPHLNFNHSIWNRITRKKKNRSICKEGFMNFIDRVLFLRDDSRIANLNLSCCGFCEADRIHAWLTIAARRRVEEVSLEWTVPDDQPTPRLPHFLFDSHLVVFNLKLGQYWGTVQMPNSMCLAPHLKTLHLEFAQLPNGDSKGEVAICCPILENFTIAECEHGALRNLSISAPKLRNLAVKNEDSASNDACKINICTPKLEFLEFSGCLYKQYSLTDLFSLICAKFRFPPTGIIPAQSLMNVLEALHHVEILELTGCFIEPEKVMDGLANPYSNLKCLKLTGWINATCVCTMLNLLRSSPCLETLVIDVNQESKAKWETDLLPSMFYNLKAVKIGRFRGNEDELEFLKLILKDAVALEKLTVTMVYYLDRENLFAKFGMRILSLPRASSTITILLI